MDAQFGLLVGLLNDKVQDKTLTIFHAPGGVGDGGQIRGTAREKGPPTTMFPEVNKANNAPRTPHPTPAAPIAGRHLRSHTANMPSHPALDEIWERPINDSSLSMPTYQA